MKLNMSCEDFKPMIKGKVMPCHCEKENKKIKRNLILWLKNKRREERDSYRAKRTA